MELNQIFNDNTLASIQPAIDKLNKLWDGLEADSRNRGMLAPAKNPLIHNWAGYSFSLPIKANGKLEVLFHLRSASETPGQAKAELKKFAEHLGLKPGFEYGSRFSASAAPSAASGIDDRPGSSVFFEHAPSGTIAGYFKLRAGTIYQLSAGHVLAPRGNAAGPDPSRILFSAFHNSANSADVALQQWTAPTPRAPLYSGVNVTTSDFDRNRFEQLLKVPPVKVVKMGVGTFPAKQEGALSGFAPRLLVDFEGQLSVSMANQFLVSDKKTRFSGFGDSGAMALIGDNERGYFPFGMLIARLDPSEGGREKKKDVFTVVTPFPAVLEAANHAASKRAKKAGVPDHLRLLI